jgi:hypothetical protein
LPGRSSSRIAAAGHEIGCFLRLKLERRRLLLLTMAVLEFTDIFFSPIHLIIA